MRPALFLFIIVLLFSCKSEKKNLYQWRGENRTGIYSESGLMKIWPDEGPPELWVAKELGNGYGSPTVTETELFVTGEKDSIAWMYRFDLEGNLRWKQNTGREWAKHYPGSRSAPTVINDLVYVATGMGIVTCLQRKTGKIVWSKDYISDFNGVLPYHGYSEAPSVHEDKILCTPGGSIHNVVALNRFNGDLVWSCKGMGERMGYNPGNIIELNSRKLFVTFSAYHLLGIDTNTGELLWTHYQDSTPVEKQEPGIGDTHCNAVIYEDGYIYYAAGDGNRGVKLHLSEDGAKIKEIWRSSDLDSYMSGFVKVGKHIYGCGTRKKNLKSFDAVTGKVVDSLQLGTGAVIAAENRLYYYNWKGELSLLNYQNGKMDKVSSFKITKGTKEHFAHPVIKKGILYQRRGDALMAYDIREKQDMQVKM